MPKYRRITLADSCQIYALHKQGCAQQQIADHLGVSQSAVSRELSRNQGRRGYRFKQAQSKATTQQQVHRRPRKLTASVRRQVAPSALVVGADQ